MMDIDLFVAQLRKHGHNVSSVISVPENAGEYEFEIDGALVSLADARLMLEHDMDQHAA
jgi:hypothetical protein